MKLYARPKKHEMSEALITLREHGIVIRWPWTVHRVKEFNGDRYALGTGPHWPLIAFLWDRAIIAGQPGWFRVGRFACGARFNAAPGCEFEWQ